MATNNSILTKITAGWSAALRTIGPEALNIACPGLGNLFALGLAYDDQRAAQNLEIFVNELKVRVCNLEQKLNAIQDGATVKRIQQIIFQTLKESDQEKISFYASVVAGELLHIPYDWDQDLQIEFTNTIIQLAGAELILLKALYGRRRDEAVQISSRGSGWLGPHMDRAKIDEMSFCKF